MFLKLNGGRLVSLADAPENHPIAPRGAFDHEVLLRLIGGAAGPGP